MRYSTPCSLRIFFGFTIAILVLIGNASAENYQEYRPGKSFIPDGNNGYRVGKIVPSDQGECTGVPDCFSATLPAVSVESWESSAERFACPPAYPNLWGWDVAQHEHIYVNLVVADRSTVTIEGVNNAGVPGDFIVSLGCSTQLHQGTVFQQSRQLAPTSMLPKRRPSIDHHTVASGAVDPGDQNPCLNVPDCNLQPQASFTMSGWASTTKSYHCSAQYPYAWDFAYTQTGSPSVSAIGFTPGIHPGTMDVLLTNWNPFQTDSVAITLVCSKTNSFNGGCSGPVDDPLCPVVRGSNKEYCSRGPVPVCFSEYEERCAPNNQLYRCTRNVFLSSWCEACPG